MSLISEETTYVVDATTKEEVFEKVSSDLLEKGLITKEFLEKILEREKAYPTGLDMSPVDVDYPNIAIPHTEPEYVKATRIVPIKLVQPVLFNNMITPEDTLDVSFLFMILNGSGETQAGLLAQIMDFINGSEKEKILKMFNSFNRTEIYQQISEKL